MSLLYFAVVVALPLCTLLFNHEKKFRFFACCVGSFSWQTNVHHFSMRGLLHEQQCWNEYTVTWHSEKKTCMDNASVLDDLVCRVPLVLFCVGTLKSVGQELISATLSRWKTRLGGDIDTFFGLVQCSKLVEQVWQGNSTRKWDKD